MLRESRPRGATNIHNHVILYFCQMALLPVVGVAWERGSFPPVLKFRGEREERILWNIVEKNPHKNTSHVAH